MNYTSDDLAYLAGFVDGEGCFFIGLFGTKARPGARSYPNYHTILKISNGHYGVLEWIQKTFGGSIDKRTKKNKLRTNEMICYSLEFTGNPLTNITKALLPYLKVKHEHAKIMIKMRETFPGKPGKVFVSEENQVIRQYCHLAMRKLNTRFHNHPLKQTNALAPCCPSAKQRGVPSPSEPV